jgi:hypothetical protein
MNAPKPDSQTDLITHLQLQTFTVDQQEIACREFRIRGIDAIIDALKKTLPKDEKSALNNHLKLCPAIDCLLAHLTQEYPAYHTILAGYIPKLHQKLH